MSSAQIQLQKIDATIEGLLDAMASDFCQEYRVGRRLYRRPDFDKALDSLYRARARLQREVARARGGSVRVAKLGRARRTSG